MHRLKLPGWLCRSLTGHPVEVVPNAQGVKDLSAQLAEAEKQLGAWRGKVRLPGCLSCLPAVAGPRCGLLLGAPLRGCAAQGLLPAPGNTPHHMRVCVQHSGPAA